MTATIATDRSLAIDPGLPNAFQRLRTRLSSSPATVVWGAICLLILLVAAFGPLFEPHNPNTGTSSQLLPPSSAHLLGTDQLGRDVFSRMLAGTQVSISIGVGGVLLGLVIGSLLGIVAGRTGGWRDVLIMRAMDVILAFPVLVLATVIAGITVGVQLHIGPVQISQTFVVLGIVAVLEIPIFARIARASTLSESREEYMVAARASGARPTQMLFGHLIPNIQGPIVVQGAFDIGSAMVVEAALSFLGVGIQQPQASWGNILGDGNANVLFGGAIMVIAPTVGIVVTAFAFNLLGDGLRNLLDPHHLTSIAPRAKKARDRVRRLTRKGAAS